MKRFLLYPHQLFEKIEMLRHCEVVLIEEPLFFTFYPFHAQKLLLHRASMKHYYTFLQSRGIRVRYIEVSQAEALYREGGEATCYDVADDWLEQKIRSSFTVVQVLKSPNFLNSEDDAMALLKTRGTLIQKFRHVGAVFEGNMALLEFGIDP